MAAADHEPSCELPPFLPFGTEFRVPTASGLMALARQHSETLRTSTMQRVHSAFELAAVAREQSQQTLRRASSFTMLPLADAASALQQQHEEIVQRSWRLVRAVRTAVMTAVAVALFPWHVLCTVATAFWAILCRPSESMTIAQSAARDARRVNAVKEE
ncbi:hypothetical protein KFE25_006649 [Diacronema lutheri]|uniref:Uncharacterized protein n=1 Tax=Diacronema lutheri TaxID=2081491 RepID=A0A8J5XSG9_DIALT|nr:hypothetical protein KFE25_006649 [Diacronema lutheri]